MAQRPQRRRRSDADRTRTRQGAPTTRRKGPTGRKRRAAAADTGPPPGTVRLQKALAAAGVASRHACEQLIKEGRVRVNGHPVERLPCFVRLKGDSVTVDGQTVRLREQKKVYVLLNKPSGVVCTQSDPSGRPRAADLVAHLARGVFPVGRLDMESTGLILLTNDGLLAQRIAHPRHGLAKTYVADVAGRVEAASMDRLKAGMHLDGRRTAGAAVKVLRRQRERTLLEIRLTEGRNREIRRLLARLGHKVRALRRVAIGPINDRGIKTGKCRLLTDDEVRKLYRLTEPDAGGRGPRRGK